VHDTATNDVFDYKFGKKGLSARQILKNLRNGPTGTVTTEIRPVLGMKR